mmetsp:Transcript_25415/g.46190  ORF Transcript_25415/g.46190 Transcript_25415/m.46190 type:complete len:249 (+) Transcript_25415:583-1329(+)
MLFFSVISAFPLPFPPPPRPFLYPLPWSSVAINRFLLSLPTSLLLVSGGFRRTHSTNTPILSTVTLSIWCEMEHLLCANADSFDAIINASTHTFFILFCRISLFSIRSSRPISPCLLAFCSFSFRITQYTRSEDPAILSPFIKSVKLNVPKLLIERAFFRPSFSSDESSMRLSVSVNSEERSMRIIRAFKDANLSFIIDNFVVLKEEMEEKEEEGEMMEEDEGGTKEHDRLDKSPESKVSPLEYSPFK